MEQKTILCSKLISNNSRVKSHIVSLSNIYIKIKESRIVFYSHSSGFIYIYIQYDSRNHIFVIIAHYISLLTVSSVIGVSP